MLKVALVLSVPISAAFAVAVGLGSNTAIQVVILGLEVLVAVAGVLDEVRRRAAGGVELMPDEKLHRAVEMLAQTLRRHEMGMDSSKLTDDARMAVPWTPEDSGVEAVGVQSLLADRVQDLGMDWDPAVDLTSSGWDKSTQHGGAACAKVTATFVKLTRLRVPRLVILGERGAGKTALALHLARELLEQREAASSPQPVPVLLPLTSWVPRADGGGLRDWIVSRLTESYPWLDEPATPTAGADSLAKVLVNDGRVLPILDGLDELTEPLQQAAINAINSELALDAPLVVTCGREAYLKAASGDGTDSTGTVVGNAVVTRLRPLVVPDQITGYLTETAFTRPQQAGWESVFDTVRAESSGALAKVLSTPLMVWLARTVYGDAPADLVRLAAPSDGDPTTSGLTRREIEDRLLSEAIPKIFTDGPAHDSTVRRWSPAKAQRWLRFLARSEAPVLAWWELDRAARRSVSLAAGLFAGAATGLSVGLGFGFLFGTTVGTVAGLAMAALFAPSGFSRIPPVTMELQIRSHLPASLAVGVMIGVVAWLAGWVAAGFEFGVTFGVAAAIAIGLAYGMTGPVDIESETSRETSPGSVLGRDRTVALVFAVVYGIVCGVACGVVGGPLLGLVFGIATGLSGGFVYGLPWVAAYGLPWLITRLRVRFGGKAADYAPPKIGVMAWLRFAITRALLAGTRQLPWRLMRFLRDAHRLGVLRQTGVVYQFRHPSLHEQLQESP